MPTPTAGLLNRPLMTLSFLRNGASGSKVRPSSISAPVPLAHQCRLLMPLPMKIAASRLGNGLATLGADVAAPQAGMDSNHGSAIVTPTPRRNARRETFVRRTDVSSRIGLGA